MLIPRPLLRPSILRYPLSLPLFPSQSIQSIPLHPALSRSKITINQILRGNRIPPKSKRTKRSEGPDLKRNPFKKAVVQKVYIVKPKVPLPSPYGTSLAPYSNGLLLTVETEFCAE